MTNEELRSDFQRNVLPDLLFNNADYFFEAIGNGTQEELFQQIWINLCSQDGDHPNNHPLDMSFTYYNLSDSDDYYRLLMLIGLPRIKKATNLAVYIGIFFGKDDVLRLFLGETDGHTPNVCIVEIESPFPNYSRINHGPIFAGCDNDPILFESSESPEKPSIFCGVSYEKERLIFADMVAKICLSDIYAAEEENKEKVALLIKEDVPHLPGDSFNLESSIDLAKYLDKYYVVISPDGNYGCTINIDKSDMSLKAIKVVKITGLTTVEDFDGQFCTFEYIESDEEPRDDIRADLTEKYLSRFDEDAKQQEIYWIEEHSNSDGFYLSYYIANAISQSCGDEEEWIKTKYKLLATTSEIMRQRILKKLLK